MKKKCRRPAMAFTDNSIVDPQWDPDPAFYLITDTDLDPGQTLL
jgi:hypothetical protein